MASAVTSAEAVSLYAAGSLRVPLSEIARAFEAQHRGVSVTSEFAASGLLRERIERGELAHVFASADVGHPKALASAQRTRTEVAVFARNKLCGLARADLAASGAKLLDMLLDPTVRVGTSTPRADPSGDYAFQLFAKAEAYKPGARAVLEGKALLLTGGLQSEKSPPGQNQYAWVMRSGKADIFLTYCTNAVLAQREMPSLQVVEIPPELAVAADYGVTVLKGAPDAADLLARFILGKEGQTILMKHGFGRGDAPPK